MQKESDSAGALKFDVVAGLTGAAVVLPKAMAYATVAGLPVAVGLYTALTPMVIYGLLGSSRVLNVSSTTTLAILTGAQLAMVVPDGDPGRIAAAAATLTLLVGVFLVAARLLRLGFLADFISVPVLTGFKAGIGLVIILDQMPKLLGLHIDKHGFLQDALHLFTALPQQSLATFLVSVLTIAALLGFERIAPRAPAPLIAVGGAIAASYLIGLHAFGVSVVGEIPRGLPHVTLPELQFIVQLAPGALGLALMSFTETIAAGRAFMRPGDPPIRAERELVATGLANIGGALLGAMPAGGGTSQTGVIRATGGLSQNASFVVAATAAATMLVLAPVLALLPNAALAAVVIVYSAPLIKPVDFASIRQVRSMEFYWAIAAMMGVLIFGTLQGIVIAIVLSLVGLASQTAYPRVDVIGRKRGVDVLRPVSPEHPDDETFEGLLILRPEGRLFFLNAQSVGDQIRTLMQQHQPRVVVLDMSRVPDIEYSALRMLMDGEEKATAEGVVVWLAALNPPVLEMARKAGLDTRLGPERLLFNARVAIEQYKNMPAAHPR